MKQPLFKSTLFKNIKIEIVKIKIAESSFLDSSPQVSVTDTQQQNVLHETIIAVCKDSYVIYTWRNIFSVQSDK